MKDVSGSWERGRQGLPAPHARRRLARPWPVFAVEAARLVHSRKRGGAGFTCRRLQVVCAKRVQGGTSWTPSGRCKSLIRREACPPRCGQRYPFRFRRLQVKRAGSRFWSEAPGRLQGVFRASRGDVLPARRGARRRRSPVAGREHADPADATQALVELPVERGTTCTVRLGTFQPASHLS